MASPYIEKILTARVYDVAIESAARRRCRACRARLGSDGAAEARGPAAGLLVQAARRLQQDGAPVAEAAPRAAWSAPRPATTPRAWRWRRSSSGIAATIVMPRTTPQHQGARRCAACGAEVRAARRRLRRGLRPRARRSRRERGLTLRPPLRRPGRHRRPGHGRHGDPAPASPGRSRRSSCRSAAAASPPGIAAYVKYLRPEVKVIGVEPEDAAGMAAALAAGERVTLDRGRPVRRRRRGAPGRRGDVPRSAASCSTRSSLVDTDAICAAIKDIFDDTRAIAEPSGALALAGPEDATPSAQGSDGRRARRDQQRRQHELRPPAPHRRARRDRRAARGAARRDDPGAAGQPTARFIEVLGQRAVTEFNYRYAGPGERADLRRRAARRRRCARSRRVIASLRERRLRVVDISDNEMAKLHVRYMVGGRAAGLADERAVPLPVPRAPRRAARVPERASARDWNITLFHYRNHGADYGRVLAGIAGAPGRARRVPAAPGGARLLLRRRDREPGLPHVPRHLRPAAAGSSWPLSASHSRHTASSTARITGPRNRPTRPKAASPPSTPNSTMMKGICAPRLMSSGRTKWSVQPTTRTIHTPSAMPGHSVPGDHEPRATPPHSSGTANGMMPQHRGEGCEEDRRADAGDPVAEAGEHALHQGCEPEP